MRSGGELVIHPVLFLQLVFVLYSLHYLREVLMEAIPAVKVHYKYLANKGSSGFFYPFMGQITGLLT